MGHKIRPHLHAHRRVVLAVLIAVGPRRCCSRGGWNYWFYNALVLLVIACPVRW
jgi:cation transport ATPase